MSKPTNISRKELLKLLGPIGIGFTVLGCNTSTSEVNGQKENKDTISKAVEILEIEGVVLLFPEHEKFDELNTPFNLRVLKKPQCIALCSTSKGISNAIKYALLHKLEVGIKSGGHCFENFSTITDGLTINLSLMRNVQVAGMVAYIEAGCRLKDIYASLIPKQRLLPAGSCATVGVSGLALGGGYGFFSRKYGLTCDHIEELEMINSKGDILLIDKDHELFKALSGAGNGHFGVVSKIKFRLQVAPKYFRRWKFKCYNLTAERYKTLLQEWISLTETLPLSAFSAFVLNHKTAVFLITDFENNDMSEMLSAFESCCDKVYPKTTVPLEKALKTYYGVQESIYFKNSSAGYFNKYVEFELFIEEVVQKVMDNKGLIYQINTLGGAINTATFAKASVYPHRSFNFLVELQAYWSKPEVGENLIEKSNEILKTIAMNGVDRQYSNYPSLAFENYMESYYGVENVDYLKQMKSKYDSTNIFKREQGIK